MLNVKKVEYDNFYEGGCETCDYGSSYANDIKITLNDGKTSKIYIDKMYDYSLTESDIMRLISNSNDINDFYINIINLISEKHKIDFIIKFCDFEITINEKQVDILESLEKQKIVFKENEYE